MFAIIRDLSCNWQPSGVLFRTVSNLTLVRRAIKRQQVFPRARSWIELMAAVQNSLIGQFRQEFLIDAPVSQARRDADATIQFPHALGWIAAAEQRRQVL